MQVTKSEVESREIPVLRFARELELAEQFPRRTSGRVRTEMVRPAAYLSYTANKPSGRRSQECGNKQPSPGRV